MESHGQHRFAAPDLLINHFREQLEQYQGDLRHLSLREKVIRLIDLQGSFRKIGRAVAADAGLTESSARGRIRQYLVAHPNQVIDGTELAVVAGISEYARRIRELREEGSVVLTGPESDPSTGLPLRPDQYLYVKPRTGRAGR